MVSFFHDYFTHSNQPYHLDSGVEDICFTLLKLLHLDVLLVAFVVDCASDVAQLAAVIAGCRSLAGQSQSCGTPRQTGGLRPPA